MREAVPDAAALLNRYPRLFRAGPLPYGIDLPHPWIPFVSSMLDGFLNLMEIHPDVTIQVTGLKEKLGRLRASYEVQYEAHVDQALRLAVDEGARVLLQEAEQRSTEICSVCGRPSQRIREHIWTAIRCTDHASRRTPEPRLYVPSMEAPAGWFR